MIRLGVDVGGTFTDFVALSDSTRRAWVWKRLTTPDDPSRAVLEGIRELLASRDVNPDEVSVVVHGTTLVSNALIQRRGAKVGLVATQGHRDAIEIGREIRYDIYDLFLDRPKPLVPRRRRADIRERTSATGAELLALDRSSVGKVAEQFRSDGVEAVAVSLLHSHVNPAHELEVGELFRRALPDVPISLSSSVAPEMREYERASTTVANAFVQPLMARYLERLEQGLADIAPHLKLSVMVSNGGIASSGQVRRLPVQLVESGPAAGTLAACRYAVRTGRRDLISIDLGGTTAKMCMIVDGTPATSNETEVARHARFKRGSGIPLLVPTVHLIEIGAGGGSIARLDRLGLLKVGPQSAGASPGPACYGMGGRDATVTDANLFLGYLDEHAFLGGRMALDRAAAEEAIGRLAHDLGIEPIEAARGVHDLVNENMAVATRRHVTEQARDPSAHTMVALGGGGPIHACGVARRLGIDTVICPPAAGAASALGCLVAPATVQVARSRPTRLAELDWAALERLYAELEDQARDVLTSVGVTGDDVAITRSADLRYVGQGFEVPVELPDRVFAERDADSIETAFTDVYRARFGRWLDDVGIEGVTWRLTGAGPEGEVDLAALASTQQGANGGGRRPVHFAEAGGYIDCEVYDRYSLVTGQHIDGPAIVQENESAAVLVPNSRGVIDDEGNLVIQLDVLT